MVDTENSEKFDCSRRSLGYATKRFANSEAGNENSEKLGC